MNANFFITVMGDLRKVLPPSKTPSSSTLNRNESQYEKPSRTKLPHEPTRTATLRTLAANNETQHGLENKVLRAKPDNVRVKSPSYNAHDAFIYLTDITSRETVDTVDIEDIMGPLVGQCGETAVFGVVHKGIVFFRTQGVTYEGNALKEPRAWIIFEDIQLVDVLRGFSESHLKLFILRRWDQIGEESSEQRLLHVEVAIQKSCEEARTTLEKSHGPIVGHWINSDQKFDEDKHAVCCYERDGMRYFTVQDVTKEGRPIGGTKDKLVEFHEVVFNLELKRPSCIVWDFCSFRFSQIQQEKPEERASNIQTAIQMATKIREGPQATTLVPATKAGQSMTQTISTPAEILMPNLLKSDVSTQSYDEHGPKRKSLFDQATHHPKKRRVSSSIPPAETVRRQMETNGQAHLECKVDEYSATSRTHLPTPGPWSARILDIEQMSSCCYVGNWKSGFNDFAVFATVGKRDQLCFKYKILTSTSKPSGSLSFHEFVRDKQLEILSERGLRHFARLRLLDIRKKETTIERRQVNVEFAIQEALPIVDPAEGSKPGGVRIATSDAGGAICVIWYGERPSFVIYDNQNILKTDSLAAIKITSFFPISKEEDDIRSYVSANKNEQHYINNNDHYKVFPTTSPRGNIFD